MKVAINLLQLSPGRVEGAVTYVKKVLQYLPEYYNAGELYIIKHPLLDIGSLDSKISIIDYKGAGRVARGVNKAARLVGLATPVFKGQSVSKIMTKHSIDVVHYPFSTIPINDMGLEKKVVLTVHDIQHEYMPDLFSEEDLQKRRDTFGPSIQRSDIVIAISNFTARTLKDKFEVDDDKIMVVPEAGELFKKQKAVAGLPDKYMFYPAGDWSHKNHKNLFKAIHTLKKQDINYRLVLTGLRDKRKAELKKYIADLELNDIVTDLGQVSQEELSYLFKHAHMLVFPSLFEGFVLPPVEAMSVGVPVACSSTTSLPEITGDAAEVFNPESVEEIVAAIKKVWNDDAYRAKLVERGHKQAAKFSWAKTAKSTHESYVKAMKQ